MEDFNGDNGSHGGVGTAGALFSISGVTHPTAPLLFCVEVKALLASGPLFSLIKPQYLLILFDLLS